MSFWRKLIAAFGGSAEAAPTVPAPAATPEPVSPSTPGPAPPEILGKTFHHHGNGIAGATPIADVWIQGIPCAANTAVSFHRNGRLASAILARSHAVEGEILPAPLGPCDPIEPTESL
jgi:hypothetical protein